MAILAKQTCQMCQQNFTTQSELQVHICKKHSPVVNLVRCDFSRQRKFFREEDSFCPCQMCQQIFTTQSELQVHICKKHSPVVNLVRYDFSNWSTNKLGQMVRHRKIYQIGRIGKHQKNVIFREKDTLYPCQICQLTFPTRCGWKVHMSRQHLPLVKCDFCNFSTNKMSGMLKHRINLHEWGDKLDEEEKDLHLHLTDSEAEEQNFSDEEEIASLHIKIEINE